MSKKFGIDRVLEPKYVLPTSAWRLDNSRSIHDDELRIYIDRIHLEGTSFKQICNETGFYPEKMKNVISDIIIRRGKLHNPVTGTGGLCVGTVDEIGPDYNNEKGLKPGDRIIVNSSLASIPVYVSDFGDIDFIIGQVNVKGYAIIHNGIPVIKVEDEKIENLLMFAFDESGSLMALSKLAEGRKSFQIVGNNMITNLLYGYAIRRKVGKEAEISCLLDKKSSITIIGDGIDRLSDIVFNDVQYLDILRPIECVEKLGTESHFDVSVNCAEIPGAETINVLATKPGGTVYFANFINNLNMALYITELISKSLHIRGAEGYLDGYEEYDVEMISEIAEYFEDSRFVTNEIPVTDEIADNPQEFTIMEKALQEDFVCNSRAMRAVLRDIIKVSKYDCNVIIFGDTGVGKEKAANIIQKESDRKMQPFIKVNCGAISPNLMESEFFGYEKGAFTGASQNGKKGYFEMANNGVIFLDEVGELPLEMQAKLLRAVQDGEFYRVGGTTPVKTNVRIISATNRDLEKFVEEGNFRRDLYYRLNVVPIKIPALRERPDDIPGLVKHFLRKYGDKFGKKRTISDSAMNYLKTLSWPGNIRELENTVQRFIISAKKDEISLIDVMTEIKAGLSEEEKEEIRRKQEDGIRLPSAIDEYERDIIKEALEKHGSTRKAAAAIGISQTQIMRKKKKYGL